jgi:hypothetical protein
VQQTTDHAPTVGTIDTSCYGDELTRTILPHPSKLNDMPPITATRRRFLELLVSVAIVHAVAIALYYALDIPRTPAQSQRRFAWIWMGLTVVVVVIGVQRLKRARMQGRANRI